MFLSLLNKYLFPTLPTKQIEQLAQYLTLLTKWNKVYNLTAIDDPQELVIKHILDSLSINSFLTSDRIIDIGTGAGLPGIPLAIINPNKKFVLLDSNSKKTRFLFQVITDLKLTNVEIVHQRVENFHPPQCFSHVVTRAFTSIKSFLLCSQHLCCPDGSFIMMKGIYPTQELGDIPVGFVVSCVARLSVPDLASERHIVVIKKDAILE